MLYFEGYRDHDLMNLCFKWKTDATNILRIKNFINAGYEAQSKYCAARKQLKIIDKSLKYIGMCLIINCDDTIRFL